MSPCEWYNLLKDRLIDLRINKLASCSLVIFRVFMQNSSIVLIHSIVTCFSSKPVMNEVSNLLWNFALCPGLGDTFGHNTNEQQPTAIY